MRLRSGLVAWMAGCLLLAGCGDLPRPFAHDAGVTNPVLTPAPDTAGIVMMDIAGANRDQKTLLQEAMIRALSENQIPAATGSGNQRSYFLQGQIEPAPNGGKRISWDLFDAAGRNLLSHTADAIMPATGRTVANPASLVPVMRETATRIAALLQPVDAGEPPKPAIVVSHISGEPAGSAGALARKIRDSMRKRHFSTNAAAGETHIILSARVFIAGPQGDKRDISISWFIHSAAGRELGRLNQRNSVPESAITARWPAMSGAIAEGAADGLVELISRLPVDAFENRRNS